MCSIAGIVDKSGANTISVLKKMLEWTEHRGPDGCGIASSDNITRAPDIENLDIEKMHSSHSLGHSRLKITGMTGIQPLKGCNDRFLLGFNGEIWNYENLRENLSQNGHDFTTDSDSEVIIHLFEEKFKNTNSFIDAIIETVKELDGEYVFAIHDTEKKRFTLVRDPVGIKQLYYGENDKHIAFCSERKPLWLLGLNPKRLLPDSILDINHNRFHNNYDLNLLSIKKLQRCKATITDEQIALKKYKQSLFNSIKKRTKGQKRIGVIFSGGIDSVLVAHIAKQMGIQVTCYVAGMSESQDVLIAKKIANDLNLDLKVNELTKSKIQDELTNIIKAIESTNHLQVDVAIPVFFSVKRAKEDGIRVMLTGQGADEIFAGYGWYPKILEEKGEEELNKSLWNDIENLYKDTLEREDKITMYHGIELRVPYLDLEVIKSAMSISEKLKINDGHVKYLHRKLAEQLSLPSYVVWRPKEAAQHGSNVHQKLCTILQDMKNQLHDNKINEIKIREDACESLGSAFRYPQLVYNTNKNEQLVLDYLGSKIRGFLKVELG